MDVPKLRKWIATQKKLAVQARKHGKEERSAMHTIASRHGMIVLRLVRQKRWLQIAKKLTQMDTALSEMIAATLPKAIMHEIEQAYISKEYTSRNGDNE